MVSIFTRTASPVCIVPIIAVGGSLGAELSIGAPAAELERRLGDWQRRPRGSRLDGPEEAPAGWDAEVAKMRGPYGAPIDDADAKAIAEYLKANYGG